MLPHSCQHLQTHRSGLRLRNDIPATNNWADGPLLDGTGPLEAKGINTTEEGRLEVERIERRCRGGVVLGFLGPLTAATAAGLLLALPVVTVLPLVLISPALPVGGSVAPTAAAATALSASMFRHGCSHEIMIGFAIDPCLTHKYVIKRASLLFLIFVSDADKGSKGLCAARTTHETKIETTQNRSKLCNIMNLHH